MRRIGNGIITLCAFVLSVVSDVRAAPLTEEEKDAFKWYDGLGLPRTEASQWVHVATGHWRQVFGKPAVNRYIDAFLLKADANHFTVFTTTAETITFNVPAGKVPEAQRVGYEVHNFEQDARTRLETLRHPPDDRDRFWETYGDKIPERAAVFVLARACAARGLGDLAHDLCVEAQMMSVGGDADNASFRKRISDDFAYQAIWKAFLEFSDPTIDRSHLLRTFRNFIAQFPDCEYTARAKETAALLEKMVNEDQAHAKIRLAPLNQMPVKDRVAELIFQLRDQNGHQNSQPGACNIFSDPRDDSPAEQLVAIGLDAVPQLIDVLGDGRFSRSVGFHRDNYFSHFVLRVGDCAEAILSRIAHRPFYAQTSDGAMLKDGQGEATKQKAQDWWSKMQQKGEKQLLVETVASGDEDAAEQAERLVEKYPDAALAALAQGVARAKSDELRVSLVEIGAKVKGDAPLVFLNDVLHKGPSIDARVAAARELCHRGKNEAITVMIEEWTTRSDAVKNRNAEAPDSLLKFLISADDPAAIHALKARIRVWGVDTRLALVGSAGNPENFLVMASGAGAEFHPDDARGTPKPATLDALEDFLIAQLDDTQERVGMTGSVGDDSFSDPRICDMAAHSLAARWKERYSFRMSAPLARRDRQRVVIQNNWRARHNLAPLPLPKLRTIEPVARDKIDPLLKLLASPEERIRKKAAADILELGIGTLPAVRKAITAMAGDDARKGAFTLLAQRLGSLVEHFDLLPADFHAEGDLKVALDGLKGKPLTSETLVAVLVAFAKKPPPGMHGIRLYAVRDNDFTGIVIRVQMVAGKYNENAQWSTEAHVSVGGEGLLGDFAGSINEDPKTADGWEALAHAMDKGLRMPPETSLEVRVSLVGR